MEADVTQTYLSMHMAGSVLLRVRSTNKLYVKFCWATTVLFETLESARKTSQRSDPNRAWTFGKASTIWKSPSCIGMCIDLLESESLRLLLTVAFIADFD